MEKGSAARVTAATAMNKTSSRSHAVFMLTLEQSCFDPLVKMTSKKVRRG